MINPEIIYLKIIHFIIVSPFTRCSRYWLFMQIIESEYRLYLVNLLKSEIWMDFFLFVGVNILSFLQSPSLTHFFFIIFKMIFREQDQLVFIKYEPLLGLFNLAATIFLLTCCHLSPQTDSLFIIWSLIKAAEPREAAAHWVSGSGLWKTETWY